MGAPTPTSPIELVDRFRLTPTDLVLEIGSGNGLFLDAIRRHGPRVLGVASVRSDVVEAFCRGVDTVWSEFSPAIASTIRTRYGRARLIVVRTILTSESLAAVNSYLTFDGAIITSQIAHLPHAA